MSGFGTRLLQARAAPADPHAAASVTPWIGAAARSGLVRFFLQNVQPDWPLTALYANDGAGRCQTDQIIITAGRRQ